MCRVQQSMECNNVWSIITLNDRKRANDLMSMLGLNENVDLLVMAARTRYGFAMIKLDLSGVCDYHNVEANFDTVSCRRYY